MKQSKSLTTFGIGLMGVGLLFLLIGFTLIGVPGQQTMPSAEVPVEQERSFPTPTPFPRLTPTDMPEVEAPEKTEQVDQAGAPGQETSEPFPVEPTSPVVTPVPQELIRAERFPNENVVRLHLLEAQSILFAEHLGSDRYEQKLLELEVLMADSMSDPDALAAVIQETFASVDVENPRFAFLQERMKADVEKSLGFLWAQTDPQGSLAYAVEADQESVLTGWMTSQMLQGKDVEGMLSAYEVQAGDEVIWNALMDVSKTDTVASLNQILNHHLDDMTLNRWREILFNGHNASDSTLAAWFQENAEVLEASEQFDEVEIVRMLRRLDPGEGPFMNSVDLALVDQALSQKDYANAASLFQELSHLYEGTIDASAVGDMPLDWAAEDFTAASEWLLANASRFSNQETLESLISSVYRTGMVYGDDPVAVLNSALSIEDETYRAMAASNVLIPQVEDSGIELDTGWVRDLPKGFAKQRVMAGYVLGLSRHSQDPVLEAQVKFQFLQDQYDLEGLKQLVEDSELSELEKNTTLLFLNAY